MSRLFKWTAVAVFALAATGCATMTVSSHIERGLSFTPYHTFDWGPADALPTGDPRLDQDPFFKDHVEGAVEKEMALKGYQRAEEDTPADLLIHYHANISKKIDVNQVDRQYGYSNPPEGATVFEYEAGTLVVDVVDPRTHKVIWRGWAQQSVEPILGHPDRMEKKINEAVKRMLERFPQGSGQPAARPTS